MQRIWTIVLLETLLIAFAFSSAQAIPVWPTARAAAVASSHRGVPGHLATGASAGVDSFFATRAPIGWLGGTDQASEGTWMWADGPQANQVFWIGGPGGSAPGGVYPNWGLARLDSGGIQNFLLRGPGGWDDADGAQGSDVRYAAPEPGTLILIGAALAGAGLAGRRPRRHARGRRARALGRTGP